MKHNQHDQAQNQKQAEAPRPTSTATLNANEIAFTPTPDEVARRTYFTYVNQGSQDGHEVQHWLAAEAELIAERNQTRVHGFHNRTQNIFPNHQPKNDRKTIMKTLNSTRAEAPTADLFTGISRGIDQWL